MSKREPTMLVFDNQGEYTQESMRRLLGADRYGGSKDRPYDGQPWTADGTRGRAPVEGVTMRDVADCIARGAALAGDSIRDAVIQSALCEIEKMMGTFPNVPGGVAVIPTLTLGPPPDPPKGAS